MADTPVSPPEIENPAPVPPMIEPNEDPLPDLQDDPPPETVNSSEDDESDQAQTLADGELRSEDDFGLSDSAKVGSGEIDDDVPDLVDHMREMVTSGRIDMSAFRGERNDDDEDGMLGPAAEE